MRYAVHDRDGWPVAMLGFSTAAWKLAPRDSFIGWTPQLREKNLPLVVDNPPLPRGRQARNAPEVEHSPHRLRYAQPEAVPDLDRAILGERPRVPKPDLNHRVGALDLEHEAAARQAQPLDRAAVGRHQRHQRLGFRIEHRLHHSRQKAYPSGSGATIC